MPRETKFLNRSYCLPPSAKCCTFTRILLLPNTTTSSVCTSCIVIVAMGRNVMESVGSHENVGEAMDGDAVSTPARRCEVNPHS